MPRPSITPTVFRGWDRFAENRESSPLPSSNQTCHRNPLAPLDANISAPRHQDRGATKLCKDLVEFLTREDPETSAPIHRAERASSVSISPDSYIARLGDKLMLLKTVETVTVGRANNLKTIAFIQQQEGKIMMTSISGMMTRIHEQENLLDNSSFTEAVLELCRVTGHDLPRNARDYGIIGQFKACHVEKKLMLWFVGHHITDQSTGLLDKKLLIELREREDPLTAVLTMDKDACEDCWQFRDELEMLTGIIFRVQVAPTVMQVEQYREGVNLRSRLVTGGFKSMEEIIAKQVTAGRRKTKLILRTRTRGREEFRSFSPEPVIFAPMYLPSGSRVEVIIPVKPSPASAPAIIAPEALRSRVQVEVVIPVKPPHIAAPAIVSPVPHSPKSGPKLAI